jgi:uncharacterized protein
MSHHISKPAGFRVVAVALSGALGAAVFLTRAASACAAPPTVVSDVYSPAAPGSISISGLIGRKLDICLSNRVMAQDVESLIQPFRSRPDGDGAFRCEFWGKWFTSAMLGYAYRPTAESRSVIDRAVRGLLATQTADGYIGTYGAGRELGDWDIWGRKYVLLGLIAYYDQTHDQAALDAACRSLDHLMEQVGPGKVDLTETGMGLLKGVAPNSILEPVVLLYQRTGQPKYLDFANYIVSQWRQPNKYLPRGLRLIDDALAGVPPAKFATPKAYEMMSCFEGLCELYRATGKREYLDAAKKYAESIRDKERMIVGSGSNQELWCDGAACQTETLEQPMETCVTVTWMKLCLQMLRLTGESRWADEMEVSLYNALLGAMTPRGEWWAYYSTLLGERVPSSPQFPDVGLSCCVANGPRGLLLTPAWAVMTSAEGPVVNLYAPSRFSGRLADGSEVKIVQETDYPIGDRAALTITPAKPCRFSLRLRVPAWSRKTEIRVNGEPVACRPGDYACLTRDWKLGDRVTLTFDMRGREAAAPSGASQMAVMRGPIVLALDNRFAHPKDVDAAVRLVADADGYVRLTPTANKPDEVLQAYEVPFEIRPWHFFKHRQITLTMCDYASAGNRWSEDNLFRVWLPQPMFLRSMYLPDTWKLIAPEGKRPALPPAPPHRAGSK